MHIYRLRTLRVEPRDRNYLNTASDLMDSSSGLCFLGADSGGVGEEADGALGKASAISLWKELGAQASPSLRNSHILLPGPLQPQDSLTPQEAASLPKVCDSLGTPFADTHTGPAGWLLVCCSL